MSDTALDTSGRMIKGWNPNDPNTDSKIAWKTLWITTASLTIAFCTWYLVSAIAPRLNEIGFDLSSEATVLVGRNSGLAGGLLGFATCSCHRLLVLES